MKTKIVQNHGFKFPQIILFENLPTAVNFPNKKFFVAEYTTRQISVIVSCLSLIGMIATDTLESEFRIVYCDFE